MKWRVLRTVFATVAASVLFVPAFSQNYYLVVGAFATENDDIREFTSYLPGQSSDTAYTMHMNNSMMHFYVLKTSSKEIAQARAQQLQQGIERSSDVQFSNTLENTINATSTLAGGNIETDPSGTSASKASEASLPSAGGVPAKPKGKYFKFTIAKDGGQTLAGKVHQVDYVRKKDVGIFASDTYVDVLHPGQNQAMTLVCGVFGYKEVEKYINYSNPSETEGAFVDEQGAWVIPYNLERLEKGDVSIMYNLSFYKDAVVMLPNSKNDLDELVNLMMSNPNYVIRVHAHCNGKNSRKIIGLGDHNNFFDVAGSVEIKGSAKQLTNLRAEAVRTYLKIHGIDENRVKLFGWGGAEMLVDENDPHARLNDRIEIEILKD